MGQVELQARVEDLEYRLSLLTPGPSRRQSDRALLRLYTTSQKIEAATHDTAAFLRNLLVNLGVADLQRLALLAEDPFPWRPLMRLCAFFSGQGFDMDDEFQHLYSIATKLLSAQGLEKLSPLDMLLLA